MSKRRELTFSECLAMMQKRDRLVAEEGFHDLLPRAGEYVAELLVAFDAEIEHGVRCWLLELIGEARSEQAFDLLCEQARCGDQSFREWGIRGLRLLDTSEARRFLFEQGLSANDHI